MRPIPVARVPIVIVDGVVVAQDEDDHLADRTHSID
jgi:hypothetical protein